MAMTIPKAFFAYPAQPPLLVETIGSAIDRINNSRRVVVDRWENNNVGGKVIIDEICRRIEDSDLLLADLTTLNPNVLFEVGFAIAKNKRVWLVLDTSRSQVDFENLRILSSVGYRSYANSGDIAQAYLRDNPHTDLDSTLLRAVIEPSLSPGEDSKLLYLKSEHDTDASVKITQRLQRIRGKLITDDPKEAPSQPLTWYGQQVYEARAVLCHLTDPSRQGAQARNARYALVAGIARGLGRSLLLLCEGDYLAPLDYRQATVSYSTTATASASLNQWLDPLETYWQESARQNNDAAARLRFVTELKRLNVGEYVAENETDELVDGYFVETKAYLEAKDGTHTIFVGRKGTGKSANFLRLAAHFASDARSILSVIKPVAYDLEGVVRMLSKFVGGDKKTFAVEGLWKFLIYSDIACSLAQKLEARAPQALSEDERDYVDFFHQNASMLSGDFAARLEKCIANIEKVIDEEHLTLPEYQRQIGITLHSDILGTLRDRLEKMLRPGARIAVIIDNLDKAWDRQSDLRALAEFLLGLLTAAGKIRLDMKSAISGSVVSLAVFLRADIFDKVQEVSREPDKLSYTRLTWADPEMLYKLLHERFAANRQTEVEADALWSTFFCDSVRGKPTKEFLVESILPRPRDFIYITKTAISAAVNRGHTRVEEEDIFEACRNYSEFATGILVIEDNSQSGVLENVIYEFAGSPSRIDHDDVLRLVSKAAKSTHADPEGVVSQLCSLTFLGIEVADNDFRFPESAAELRKVQVLAKKLCHQRGSPPRYLVHQAFRPFLEIND